MLRSRWLPSWLRAWLRPKRKPIVKRPLRRSLLTCELLEDRLSPATSITAAHIYELNGSLADELGGPALVADGGTLDATRYTFDANQGLSLTGGLADTSTYSVVMTFEVDSLANFYIKILDFQNQLSDEGLYIAGGALQLYPGAEGAGLIAANTDVQVVVTRDNATGETKVYLNGNLQQTYVGAASDAALVPYNILTFFEDDTITGTEAEGGSVDRIVIYHGVLTAADVAMLSNPAPTVAVDVAAVAVNEGQTAGNTGGWGDVEGEDVTVTASIGDIVQNLDGTWSWSYLTSDGPVQSQTVTITATDASGGVSFATFELVVHNVAPLVSDGFGTSIGPAHVYELNGSLNDELGGPTLLADGGVLGSDRYTFGPNQGLRLIGALSDTTTFSIVMTLEVDALTPFYKKLLDFEERSNEAGLYVNGDQLRLYPSLPGSDTITADTDFMVVLTRDGLTGETRLYLNGVLQMAYTGLGAALAVPLTNVLTFFEDDLNSSGLEAVGGSVDRIAIYHGVLSDADVAALAAGSTTTALVSVLPGELATHSGTWNDPGADGTVLTASMGDVVQNGDGTWNWSLDTTGVPSGIYTVNIVATDNDNGQSSISFTLEVLANSPPSVGADQALVTAPEGQTALASGTWSDPDVGDVVTLTASVGDVVQNADGTWSWSFATSDGPAQSQTVTITATDNHGDLAQVSFDLTVENVPPEFTSLSSSNPTLANRSLNGDITIQGTFADVSADIHTVTVDWGDGSPVETLASVDQINDAFSSSHHYATGGVFTITVTITDSDGDSVTETTSAVVSGVGLVNGTLYVIGTFAKDQISVDMVKGVAGGPPRLRVKLNGMVYYFDPAAVNQIVIGADADDIVQVRRDVSIDVLYLTATP